MLDFQLYYTVNYRDGAVDVEVALDHLVPSSYFSH